MNKSMSDTGFESVEKRYSLRDGVRSLEILNAAKSGVWSLVVDAGNCAIKRIQDGGMVHRVTATHAEPRASASDERIMVRR